MVVDTPMDPLIDAKRRGEAEHGLFHPSRMIYRFTMLFVISLVCFGSYFSYDEVAGIGNDLQCKNHTSIEDFHTKWTAGPLTTAYNDDCSLDISGTQFGSLYSVYSLPNFVLPLFGGVMSDYLGYRLSALILVLFVVVGTTVVALAPLVHSYWIMVIGRGIFGVGAESLNVTQSAMITKWFGGTKDLAMAFGLVLAMSRLGDAISLSGMSWAVSALGDYKTALWIGVLMCELSLISVLVYMFLDSVADRVLDRQDEEEPDSGEPGTLDAVWKGLIQLFNVDVRFWIISFLCLVFYAGVLPFVANASDYLQAPVSDEGFGYNPKIAGLFASIVIFASMLLSPFLGKYLDMVGNRPFYIIMGSCVIIPAHVMLAAHSIEGGAIGSFYNFLDNTFHWNGQVFWPILPIVMIGFAFSLVPSALWPCVPLIVPAAITASAFGLMTAIQNFGLFASQLAMGYIQTKSWSAAMWVCVGIDVLGLALGVLLWSTDKAKGGELSKVYGGDDDDKANSVGEDAPLIQ